MALDGAPWFAGNSWSSRRRRTLSRRVESLRCGGRRRRRRRPSNWPEARRNDISGIGWRWRRRRGASVSPAEGRLASDGGDGGKGFPGETRIVELAGLTLGTRFEIKIGKGGGGGGGGGRGYEASDAGGAGANGFVLFVPRSRVNGDS